MESRSLSSHSIMVIRKGSPDKLEMLDRIGDVEGTPLDLYDVFVDYIQKNQDIIQNTMGRDSKAWKINPNINVNQEERIISGKISYGESGSGADLFNVNTNIVDYEKKPHHAAMMPYYFLIHIPLNSPMGYIILERVSNNGIQGILSHLLHDVLNTERPRYQLSIHNIFSRQYFEEIKTMWFPKELRMFKRNTKKLSGDIADNVMHENVESREIVAFPLELVIRSGFGKQAKGMLEKFFQSILLGEDVVQQLFIDWNLPEDYDRLTFVVREKTADNKSKTRTVKMEDRIKRLSLEDRLLPHYNITDTVVLDNNGHSAYYSIDKLARDKLRQLIDESMSN